MARKRVYVRLRIESFVNKIAFLQSYGRHDEAQVIINLCHQMGITYTQDMLSERRAIYDGDKKRYEDKCHDRNS